MGQARDVRIYRRSYTARVAGHISREPRAYDPATTMVTGAASGAEERSGGIATGRVEAGGERGGSPPSHGRGAEGGD
jgi:hypothetical protein